MRIFLLTLLFLLSSASFSKEQETFSLKYDHTANITIPNTISKSDLDYDFNMLKYSLRNAYAGYFFHNKDDVEDGIEVLEKKISKLKEINSSDFCKEAAKAFANVKDQHLTFKLGRQMCSNYTHVGNVGKRMFQENEKIWTVKLIKEKEANVLAISIDWFPSSSSSVWTGMIKEVEALLNKADLVILDMRGNGGGDSTIGYMLAKVLSGAENLVLPYGKQFKVVTKAGLESRENLYAYYARASKDEKERDFYRKQMLGDKEKYTDSKSEVIALSKDLKAVQKFNAIKPTYLLQDRACASACEATLDYFEYIDGVKKVGENSAGLVHFGNLGFVVLPKSGLQINIASTFSTYRDKRFIESSGVTPDVVVPKGSDAYEFAFNNFIKK